MTGAGIPRRRPVVLYVDDEASNRIVFEHSFNDEFQIHLAQDADQALSILEHQPIEVVVTDQRMPKKSGMDLLHTVKETYPSVVRIVVTAYADLDPILRAVNEGLVARYLMKPWRHEELRGALHWAAEVFRSGAEDGVVQTRILHTERMATLGTLAASLVHDLRQPLSYMRYNGERLSQLRPAVAGIRQLLTQSGTSLSEAESKAVAALAAEYEELVTDINAGTALISELLKELASWIAPVRSEAPYVADGVPVINFALSLCRRLTQQAKTRVSYEGPPRLEGLAIEAAELTQILVNLVSNAAQAIEASGRPGNVLIKAEQRELELVLQVIDDGPGMPPEVLKKVGMLFFSTRAGGTGLGLNQCLRLVSRAGGDVRVESEVGRGTTVTLNLRRTSTSGGSLPTDSSETPTKP